MRIPVRCFVCGPTGNCSMPTRPPRRCWRWWPCRVGDILAQPWPATVAEVLSAGKVSQRQWPCGPRWYDLVLAPFGQEGYVNIYAMDCTARRRAELDLKALNAELEQRVQRRTHQLRDLTMNTSLVQERQRRRLADELHDTISVPLALVRMQLSQLVQNGDDTERAIAGQIGGQLDDCIARTRSLMFALSPPVLHELGLAAAVEWYLEQLQGPVRYRLAVRGRTRYYPGRPREPADAVVRGVGAN